MSSNAAFKLDSGNNSIQLYHGCVGIFVTVSPLTQTKIPSNRIVKPDEKLFLYANEDYRCAEEMAFISALCRLYTLNSFSFEDNKIILNFDKTSPIVTVAMLQTLIGYVYTLRRDVKHKWVESEEPMFSPHGKEWKTESTINATKADRLSVYKFLKGKQVIINHPRM